VVIQVSPLAEPVQQTQGVQSQETRQAAGPERNGLGVFARILAGLLGKTAETHTSAETHHALLPASDAGELDALSGEAKQGGPSAKGLAAGLGENPAAEQYPAFHDKTGQAGSELPKTTETGRDKNLYIAANLLAGNPGEQAYAPGKTAEAASYYGAPQTAEALRPKPEAAHRQANEAAAGIPADAASGADSGEAAGKQLAAGAVAAQADGSVAKLKTPGENPRTGAGRPEAAAAARDGSGEGLLKQAEAGKTLAETHSANKAEAEQGDRRRATVADARYSRTQTESAYRDGLANGHVETRMPSEGAGREAVLEVRLPTQNGASSATTVWESRPGQAMENMLARELHQHLNGDIVRQASIILRDGGDGTIRLALRPESLGNVKIHLEMAENKITGYIVVESEEALRAFERELASLEKEFRDSGFEGAELKMSLADKEAERQGGEDEDGRFISGRAAASRYDAAAEAADASLAQSLYWQGSGTVDVLA